MAAAAAAERPQGGEGSEGGTGEGRGVEEVGWMVQEREREQETSLFREF